MRLSAPPCPVDSQDLDALVAMEALCFSHPDERFNPRQIRGLLRNSNAYVVFARDNGILAGWAVGLLRRHGPTLRSGRLYALAVHPDFRGRGLGARLAESVFAELRRRGARTLTLEVGTHNLPAQRLYQRLGFQPAEHLPDYYAPGLHGLRMKQAPAARP